MHDLTYVVSAYERSVDLNLCLLSLRLQTHKNFTVSVVDNQKDDLIAEQNRLSLARAGFNQSHSYYRTMMNTCCQSSDWGALQSDSEYLAFPSDDSYYCEAFGEKMLAAARKNDWDLVYCDCMYRRSKLDHRYDGTYWHLETRPEVGFFDKTLFIIRRTIFPGFRDHLYHPFPDSADGRLAEELARNGVRMGRVPELLVVHN